MNAIHAHLIFNHFPSIGLVIGLIFWAAALILRDSRIKKLVAGLIILISIMTVLTNITGENAEDSVEKISGISEANVEAHEESAELANGLMILFGISSLIFLWSSKKGNRFDRLFTLIITIMFLVEIGIIFRTGYLGGMIRHPEAYNNQKIIQEYQIDRDDNDEHKHM